LPQDAQGSKLGLSNTLEPGRFAKLSGSDELAFRVKFNGQAPESKQLYWRGPVLSDFDGVVWRVNPTLAQRSVQTSQRAADQATIAYTMVAEPHKQTFRVLLDVPLKADNGITLSTQASAIAEPMLERETIRAFSHPGLRWGMPESRSQSASIARIALQSEIELPANANPRTLAYAAQLRLNIGTQLSDPTPFIQAVLSNYRALFTYSTQPPTPKGRVEDAIDGFLFDTRTGYCEHFAASFVVLMRAMDFPARIVTGYQGGELNPQDGWWVVPQNAAHAWAEVLHPTLGWLRVDPTSAVAPWRVLQGGNQWIGTAGQAPTGVQQFLKTTRQALLPLQQWTQATLRVWQDYGLNYGKNNQQTLFKTLGFAQVNSTAIASMLGGSVGVWTLVMLWLHRQRTTQRSAHAAALAQFDALCRQLTAPMHTAPPPRNAAQTPTAWLLSHQASLPLTVQNKLQQWLLSYERDQYAGQQRQ
jgi:protein-glutamine gamma-glutamyltransferase